MRCSPACNNTARCWWWWWTSPTQSVLWLSPWLGTWAARSPTCRALRCARPLTNKLSLDLLVRYGGPTGLAKAGPAQVKAWARKTKHRSIDTLVDDVFTALAQQTVTVTGTAAVETVVPRLAEQIKNLHTQRTELAVEVERLLDDFPLRDVLTSMPGVGIKTAATILLAIGDGTAFPTAGHLAAYAGIAPVTRRSGKSIRGEHPSRSGNKQLKNALFRSSWVASNCDPESAAYYQRKRAQGKKHNAAIICLARRRCDVIHAMLKTGTLYQPRNHKNHPPQLDKTIGTHPVQFSNRLFTCRLEISLMLLE